MPLPTHHSLITRSQSKYFSSKQFKFSIRIYSKSILKIKNPCNSFNSELRCDVFFESNDYKIIINNWRLASQWPLPKVVARP